MDYKKIIDEQIEKLQEGQERLEGRVIEIDDYVKISKAIGELAAMANKM